MDSFIRKKFIKEIGQSGLSFMEVACISGIPEITLFKFAGGVVELDKESQALLADILDCAPEDIFPCQQNRKDEHV